mgnify:CR=1 FL=1
MYHKGDIVMVDFNPIKGHEQGNYRPVLVLNDLLLPSGMNIVVPITSKKKSYPLEVELNSRTKTQGVVLCFQIRTVDLNARPSHFVERLPDDLIETCIDYVRRIIEY